MVYTYLYQHKYTHVHVLRSVYVETSARALAQ